MKCSPVALTLLLSATLVLATPLRVALAATPASSPADVISELKGSDGAIVTIEGEAIGEALRADSTHVWVNVLGEGAALGVYLTREAAAVIRAYGDYAHTGDTVRVTGRLNAACDVHGGDADVHAATLEVLRPGFVRPHPVNWWKAIAGLGTLGLAALQLRRFLLARRRHEFR